MKNIKLTIFIVPFILFISCGAMERNDRISRRNDFFNRFSKKEIVAIAGWKMGVDKLF